MPAIIILSMHRSGSSLTASIIQKLGVHIGDELLGTHPSQPNGHFENVHFYRLNMDILRAAGGDWLNPPEHGKLMAVKPQFKGRIVGTINREKKDLWGWKDPRTCLTLPLYLPHLIDPRFVLVYRNVADIVSSLGKRSGKVQREWNNLTTVYQDSMEKHSAGHPVLCVQFENLTTRATAQEEIKRLDEFVCGNGNIAAAAERINYR